MTVEFPSPVEEPNNNNNESSSEDNKLSCQQSNASSEDLMDNAYNSAHNVDNDTILRRISEEVSDEKSLFNTNNTITTAILDNDTTLPLEKERECPMPTRRQSSYNSEEDEQHEYQRDNSINILEEEDNELLGSIAGGRYGGRPSMRCSTSSNEDGNNIPYSNSSNNSHYLVASKRKVVSSMTSITRRSGGMESEVISTAINATGGGGGTTTTNISYHPKNSAGSGGGAVNNNNNNEREEEVEDGYDVRAAFEKEHKGEFLMCFVDDFVFGLL